MDNKLFVSNIPFKFNREKLKELFSPYGEITEVIILREKETGRSKGRGFVTFNCEAAANNAFAEMNNKEILGRQIKLNYAEPKKDKE